MDSESFLTESWTIKIGAKLLQQLHNPQKTKCTFKDVNKIMEVCLDILEFETIKEREIDLLSMSLSFFGTLSRDCTYDHMMLLCQPFPLLEILIKTLPEHQIIQQKVLRIICDFSQSSQLVSTIYSLNFHIYAMNVSNRYSSNPQIALYGLRTLLGIKLDLNSTHSTISMKNDREKNLFYQLCCKCLTHIYVRHRSYKSNHSVHIFLENMISDQLIHKQNEKMKSELIRFVLTALPFIKNREEVLNMLYYIRNFIKIAIKKENLPYRKHEDMIDQVMYPKSQHGRIVHREGAFDVIVKLINDCDDFDKVAVATQILGRISYYGCRRKLRMTKIKFRGIYMNIAELTCHFCSKDHASAMYTFLRLSLPIGGLIDKEKYPYTPIMLCRKEKNYEVEKVLKYWQENESRIWKFSSSVMCCM